MFFPVLLSDLDISKSCTLLLSSGRMLKIFTVFACLLEVHVAHGRQVMDIRTWIRDTNFDNPENWAGGSLPCGKQRAVFPPNGRVVSMLATHMTISELVLPLDGQVVFANGSELTLTGGVGESTCVQKDVRFLVPNHHWYDPNNWNVTSWRAFPSNPNDRELVAIPHAYRIPCRTDHVTFPRGRSFKVVVEDAVAVGKMSINNVNYNNEEMSIFLVSQTGNFLFPGNPEITINGNGCSELRGCTCGNDEPQVLSRICKHLQKCPPVECSDPIQPVGHCCKICASVLDMEYQKDKNFKMENLLDLHDSFLGKGEFVEVVSFTSRTYEDKIQTVIVDSGESKGIAADAAHKIFIVLSHDTNVKKFYKLKSVKLYSSTSWNSSFPVHGTMKGVSAGGIVGILFAVALTVGGVLGALYIYRKRHIPGFSFARFDANVGRIQVELSTTPHEMLQPDEPESPETEEEGFDNPVYGKATTGKKEKPDQETTATEEQFVENPMFMLYQEKSDSESAES